MSTASRVGTALVLAALLWAPCAGWPQTATAQAPTPTASAPSAPAPAPAATGPAATAPIKAAAPGTIAGSHEGDGGGKTDQDVRDDLSSRWWRIPIDDFTLASVLVGMVQALVAFMQYTIYRRQAAIMNAQTAIQRRQARLSTEQTRLTKELQLLTQGALISYETIEHEAVAAGGGEIASWLVTVHWRNYGPTPARNVEPVADVQVIAAGDMDRFTPALGPPSRRTRLPVAPQHSFMTPAFQVMQHDLTDPGRRVICTVCVYYGNVFEKDRLLRTQLCFEVVHREGSDIELDFPVLGEFSMDAES